MLYAADDRYIGFGNQNSSIVFCARIWAKLLEFEVGVCPEFTSAAKAGSFSGFTAGLKGLLHPVLREDRIKNRVLHRVTKVAIV